MKDIEIALITQIMQFSKNRSVITIETREQRTYTGFISFFDGSTVRLDNGKEISCKEIVTITEGAIKIYSDFVGKRVHVKNKAGVIFDGVFYDEDNSYIQLITENGVEQIEIDLIDSLQEANDVALSDEVENAVEITCDANELDKTNVIRKDVLTDDVRINMPVFTTELAEGTFFDFEKSLAGFNSLSDEEKRECIDKFNKQEYIYVLNYLKNKLCNEEDRKLQEDLVEYLKQVIEKYDLSKNDLIQYDSLFFKGIVASKIECNLDKGFNYFVQSFVANPENKKSAIYRGIMTYLSSKNIDRAAEVCDYLLKELKTVEPQYDQAICLKTILIVYQNKKDWNKYLDVLEYLVAISQNHVTACSNLILKYLAIVEKEYIDERIEKIYSEGIKLGNNLLAMILRFANYINKSHGSSQIEAHIEGYINSADAEETWNSIKAKYLPELLLAEDKYAFIRDCVSAENIERDATDKNNENSKEYVEEISNKKDNLRDMMAGEKEETVEAVENSQQIEERLEAVFRKYIDKNDYNGAKSYFSKALKKHDSDQLYNSYNLRAELYYAQAVAFSRGKHNFSERHSSAMSKWLVDHEPMEAERLFMDDIMADSPSKGTTILSYIDMMAVEFGLTDAIKVLLDLQQEIKYCERNEKVAFYEKKYTFAFCSGDILNALSALETLRTAYYNKTKLGNCWYRSGECYRKLKKWKQAKNSYGNAIEFGYMKSVCEHQIVLCRRNMGEHVGEDSKPQIVELESVDDIKKEIETLYNDIRYKEAYDYISELAESYPDNEDLAVMAKAAGETLQRYIDNGNIMPKRKDKQSIALRAWHIENNYSKAKNFFVDEISHRGSKYVSCIMDLSELLLHTEGIDSAISSLESYEPDIRKLKMGERTGYYERLYLMYLKNKDKDKIVSCLEELISIYSQIDKKDKVAYSYYRAAIVYFQAKQYEHTITKMLKAIDAGYHSNVCYKCVAFSYAYLGKRDDSLAFIRKIEASQLDMDSNLQITLKEIEEQVNIICSGGCAQESEEETSENENVIDYLNSEFILGFNTRFEAFFVERYGTRPVGISIDKIDQNGYKEADVSNLERKAREHKLRERTGFFGTAAYIENQINGTSYKYYELLRNSSYCWGLELQSNGFFNCACACFEFSLENDIRTGKSGGRNAVNYLACITRCHKYNVPDSDDELRKEIRKLISNIMDTDGAYGENALRELILLINKSKYIREVLDTSNIEGRKAWIAQLANFLSESKTPSNYKELFDVIAKKCRQDENALLDFSNKVRASKVFNEEQLTELRSFKNKVFIFDSDIKYLDLLVNAYEKGIEIYDYEDYDNRMATIGNVQKRLTELVTILDEYPTYFGINFLLDIIDNLLEIIGELSRKTKDELKPEILIQIPIADVPVVEGKQGISVTVFNKENSASAKDVRLKVKDVDGNELSNDISIVQYLKGGRSASKELEITSQGETYTVKIVVTYIDHEDVKQTQESLVSISSANDVFEPIKSPYFTGDSIDVTQHSIFVGRDVLLDTLENALVNNKSGCEIIYGQKRCGKSSIANFLEDRLREKYLIIKFSIGAARSTKSIYTNVKDLLVEKIDDLIDADTGIDSINEDLLNEIETRTIEDDEDFVSFIRLVHRKLCKPLGKEILLMIDEFTHLYRYVKEDRRQVAAFMDTWKKLLEADLFKAVLIGQDTMPNFIKEFQNQFQVTQLIRVDRLDDESVRKLIEEPLRLNNGETRFMENSVDLIAGWFYGQPYYIQLYCDRLVNQMNIDKRVRVTNALAEKVKAMMLEEVDEDLFDNLISRGDESGTEGECYDILKQIAQLTKNSEWAEIDDIQVQNKDNLIDDLINRAVIRKKDNKCKILISFFREWLNMN